LKKTTIAPAIGLDLSASHPKTNPRQVPSQQEIQDHLGR
jgi:hypothetical protein